ncbi:hypothetical protein SAMD00019534_052250 [Acytostelium subglobosum LB1]|uniref:hypothetical protein n=1 Tax=Acytostelium subglobosum LB1 TaxID=1410327 RepID=UPI00064487A1|nr:hypothetical protein SAMD00019534_052250 [Acytostelium subglobosum LB1]GAM22050.1 hypothetical protein SAMD00019534_052250 [Acytostelium subglobosum LB1]|eukprot:XP_012755150.1 hypothetical protein SAMD00019534_052250 [Acytostelium subglobosum LB1]
MRVASTLLYIIVLAGIAGITFSENTPPLDRANRCEPYFGDAACLGLLKSPESVFVAAGWTQERLLNEMNIKAIGLLAQNIPECAPTNFTNMFVCNTAFKPCINVTLPDSTTIAMRQGECQADCMTIFNKCKLPASLLNCSDTYQNTNIMLYPPASNNYDLSPYGGPSAYTVDCLRNDFATNGSIIIKCPAPLLPRASYGEQQLIDEANGYTFASPLPCVFPCPAPIFKDSEWSMLRKMVEVVSIISFICTSLVIFTYLVINPKRDRHSISLTFMAFGIWCIGITDMILADRGTSVYCPEPDRMGVQSDAYCGVSGALYQFGAVTGAIWWATMGFDLWLVIRRVKKQISFEKYYMVILSVVSIFFTILPAGMKKYSASFGRIGCWIGDDIVLDGVFWAPFTLCILVGATFISLILREVYRIVKRAENGKKKSTRLLRFNLKPFLIIVILLVEFIYLFAYNLYYQINKNNIKQDLSDWVHCLMERGQENCTLKPLPLGAHFTYFFFVRLLGIEILIFYGLNRRSKAIWANSIFFKNRFYNISMTLEKTSMTSNSQTSGQSSNSVRMSSQTGIEESSVDTRE